MLVRKKNKNLLDIIVWWTLVMLIFGSSFEGILSKTASYLMKHIQNRIWKAFLFFSNYTCKDANMMLLLNRSTRELFWW